MLTDNISSFLIADNSTCRVEINGKLMKKSLGEVWNSVNDLCQKYTCEMGPNGEAIEKDFREYCLHSCHNVRGVDYVSPRISNNFSLLYVCTRITTWYRKKVNVVVNVSNDGVQ